MAITPLPVGGTLFAPGGGNAESGVGHVTTPSLGKNSMQQNLGSPHNGLRQTITPGDPTSRALGQYGKGHSFGDPLAGGGGGSPLRMLRGGTGQMRRIRGGLGPGRMGQPGSSKDYSMSSPDQE